MRKLLMYCRNVRFVTMASSNRSNRKLLVPLFTLALLQSQAKNILELVNKA